MGSGRPLDRSRPRRGSRQRSCRWRCAARSHLIVGPVLGGPTSWFPTYLGAAIVVELLALTPMVKRHISVRALAGLLVGSVGLYLESFWISAVYHYPWPTGMWPEALAMAVPVSVFMGMCGALLAMVITGRRLPGRPSGHRGTRHRAGYRRRGRQRTTGPGAEMLRRASH